MTTPELTDFVPGQPVAVFRMPIPMDGINIINDCIARLYGEGEWTVGSHASHWSRDEPNSLQINYPADGVVGKRRTSRRKPNSDDTMITRSFGVDAAGDVSITIEDATDGFLRLCESMTVLFAEHHATNYLQMHLMVGDGGQDWIVRLQKPTNPTPHDLHKAAEARTSALVDAVRYYLAGAISTDDLTAALAAARQETQS